jgi:hypothetical protein
MPAKSWKELMNAADEGAKEFAILDEGMYEFVIKDPAKVGQTSKENPKFTINPSVESGPRTNARVFHTFSVSDSPYAMKMFFFGDLATLGLGPSFFDQNPTEQQIASALQGRRFVAEVFHEDGNDGKKYARLRNFAAPVSAPPTAGVPAGLPTAAPLGVPTGATAPVAPAAPTAVAAAPGPWDTVPQATAPAFATGGVPLPPAFG